MTDDRIKSCPFCGSLDLNFVEGWTFRWIVAECQSCGARCGETRVKTLGDQDPDGDKAAALAEWNRRAIEAECRVPEGYVLVPVEPSDSQLDVAVSFALNVRICSDYNWSAYMRDVYARMISAAPKPEPERKHETVPTMAEPDCECGAVASEHCPACEPVAQEYQPLGPATTEDQKIYDSIAANYSQPVAQEPVAFGVREEDGSGGVWSWIAEWPEAAHEHINDAIDRYLGEVGDHPPKYTVVPLYRAPHDLAESQKDAERLDFIIDKALESRTGVTIDYHRYVEDDRVVERGFRIAWFHNLNSRFKTLREAIDAAIDKEIGHERSV